MLILSTANRFLEIPAFGRDTIRRFSANCSEMKKLAARDFENLLQVCYAMVQIIFQLIKTRCPSALSLCLMGFCLNLITRWFVNYCSKWDIGMDWQKCVCTMMLHFKWWIMWQHLSGKDFATSAIKLVQRSKQKSCDESSKQGFAVKLESRVYLQYSNQLLWRVLRPWVYMITLTNLQTQHLPHYDHLYLNSRKAPKTLEARQPVAQDDQRPSISIRTSSIRMATMSGISEPTGLQIRIQQSRSVQISHWKFLRLQLTKTKTQL